MAPVANTTLVESERCPSFTPPSVCLTFRQLQKPVQFGLVSVRLKTAATVASPWAYTPAVANSFTGTAETTMLVASALTSTVKVPLEAL